MWVTPDLLSVATPGIASFFLLGLVKAVTGLEAVTGLVVGSNRVSGV